MHLGIYYFI